MNTATFLISGVMAVFAGFLANVQQWGGAVFFTIMAFLFIGDGIAAAIKEVGK